jgi:RimJ/RimL family protein N-acetyltransferase
MDQFIYREAQINDAQSLIDYLKIVTGETNFLRMYPDEVKFSVSEEEDFVRNAREQDNSILLVCLDRDAIVAVAGIHGQQFRKFRHCAEFGVSVRREYWGKGIGQQLTKRIINWSKENSVIKKISLHVNAENEIAIKIYEKLGFIREGTLTNDFFYEGRYIDTHIYGMQV